MRTMDEIYASLAESFAQGAGTAPVDGGDMALRLRAVAAELYSLEAQADFVLRQCFPQTASGAYLDRHAQMRGLERGAATHGAGELKFSLAEAAAAELSVPAGTECVNGAGSAFVTTEEGLIPAGETECLAAARAVSAGSGGNAPAGSICYMKLAPAGVAAVTNPAAFSGGGEEESDEKLRERVVSSYRSLSNGANEAWYRKRVLDIPEVAAVTVLPRARGVGTVDIVIGAEGGLPSGTLLEQVKAELDAEREICVDIGVSAPEAVTVDVSAALTVAEDYEPAAVIAQAEEAVRGLFGGENLGRSVYRAKIGAVLMGIQGVENYALSAPVADVSVSSVQLPLLGSLSISGAV